MFNFIINNVGYTNMEKLSSIIYNSALETYDLLEKNKSLIVGLITMFLPKETRDFIFKKEFEFDNYYSKSELEAMEIDLEKNVKNVRKKKKKKVTSKKSNKKSKASIGLSKSINQGKVYLLRESIPQSIFTFFIFFSYLSLHNIYFWTILFIILFVTDVHYLLCGLIISFINAVGIVVFLDCPIYILERKYRNKLTHNQHFICNIIKKIYDEKKHYSYEYIIEQLIFTIFLFLIKISSIVLYKSFKV